MSALLLARNVPPARRPKGALQLGEWTAVRGSLAALRTLAAAADAPGRDLVLLEQLPGEAELLADPDARVLAAYVRGYLDGAKDGVVLPEAP